MSVFTKRLKEARKLSKLSQMRLGVLAGVDEASASARVNQWERGKHEPGLEMIETLAKVLDVPSSFFLTQDDSVANLLLSIHRMKPPQQREFITVVEKFLEEGSE